MSVTSKEYLNVSTDIVGGLIETVSLAQLNSFPTLAADPDDIAQVIDALRVLRPKLRELETFESILYMGRGQWDDAIRVLSGLIEQVPGFLYAKGLMAFCLSSKGDPAWRQVASEVMQGKCNPETRRLIRALEARDDLREAIGAYEKTGRFVLPESCTEQALKLQENNNDTENVRESADQRMATQDYAQQSGYLRA